MRNALISAVSAVAAMLSCTGGADAAQLIYGFNGTGGGAAAINGFALTYDQNGNGTLSQSTTTGVSESTGALHFQVGATTSGYYQLDAVTTSVPAALIAPGTKQLTLDASANYNPDAVYIGVAPAFFLDGTTGGGTAFGTKLLAGNQTLPYDAGVTTIRTRTYSLLFKDPYATAQPGLNADGHVANSAIYSPGEILAALLAANPTASASIGAFGLEMITNTEAGDDLYIDNISIVPEPVTVSAALLGGLLIGRRRRAL